MIAPAKRFRLSLVHGRVTAVGAASVTIKHRKSHLTFTLNSKSKYKGVKKLSEVRAGDAVMISYLDDGPKTVLKLYDKKPGKYR